MPHFGEYSNMPNNPPRTGNSGRGTLMRALLDKLTPLIAPVCLDRATQAIEKLVDDSVVATPVSWIREAARQHYRKLENGHPFSDDPDFYAQVDWESVLPFFGIPLAIWWDQEDERDFFVIPLEIGDQLVGKTPTAG